MCGIFGFFSKRNISSEDFTKYLKKRGPDEQKIFNYENFTFGATRLSIRDIKNGSQPFFFKNYNIYASLNGEIYNYSYLRSLLEKKGHKFISHCDTELIGPGYHYFGNKFFEFINGMFALSILDLKNKELIIVRDNFGIKPIYYYHENNEFFFSSSAKSIYNLNFFEKKINHESIISILKHRYIKGNAHIFKKIFLIKPGEILKFSVNKGITKTHFKPTLDSISQEEYKKKILNFFQSDLQNYKIADVDLCLLISSGVDSNILLNFLYDQNLKLFNISFSKSKFDETKRLEKLLSKEQKKNLVTLPFEDKDFEKSIDSAVSSFDSPICDSVIFPMSKLFNYIGKKYKVTISGEGADEIFGGYYFLKFVNYFNLLKRFKLLNIVKYLIKITNIKILNLLISYQGNFGLIFKDRIIEFLNTKNLSIYEFNNFISVFSDNDLIKIFKNYKQEEFLFLNERKREINIVNIIDDLKNNWLPNYNCYKLDQLSMHNSLEARVPFLDNFFLKIIEFMKKKTTRYNGKKILRNILNKNFNKKITQKIAFQNYLSEDRKKLILDYAEKNIKNTFKIFKLINFKEYQKIMTNFKISKELIAEKQFFSLFILAIWLEKNY